MKLLYRNKFTHALAAIITTVTISGTGVLAAPAYGDVPQTHWAYKYVAAVSDKGLMVGDTSANFRPDDLIDKFDTSRVLARAAGFKYENISASEQEYYDNCYNKNKNFLAQYDVKFTKWKTSADREIAFLLEKDILTSSDLNQFVIVDGAGNEQLRALSRGEAAVFITKLMGKNTEALADTTAHTFKDDASIPGSVKPYVYYLKGIGVVSGDTEGNFKSNGAVTRAALAVMLTNALNLLSDTQTPAPADTQVGTSNVSTISGSIDTYYANLNAVQVLSASGDKIIYRLSADASVYIDGVKKPGTDLKAGMLMSGVLINDELTSIQAQGTGVTTPSNASAPTSNSVSTASASGSSNGNTSSQYTVLDGTIASIELGDTSRTIGIEIKTVNPRDNSIITDVRTFNMSSDCKITRGEDIIPFSEILRGDIARARVSGTTMHELALEERLLILKEATLEEKRYDAQTAQATLVVLGANERRYELRIATDTSISRKDTGITTWTQLRVGDKVDLTAEYGVLKDLSATGSTSTVEGWIGSIFIADYQSYITLRDPFGNVTKYYVATDSADVYSIRVGDKLRLNLDSLEVATFSVLQEASSNAVTGFISSVSSGRLSLNNTQPYGSGGNRNIELNSSTVIIDSATGEKVTASALKTGQRVYVVCQSAVSGVAKTVTILND